MRNRLTVKFVERVNTPGKYTDGGGLLLQVQKRADGHTAKSWLVRYRSKFGRMREMGIGTFDLVPLADARAKALQVRQKAAAGTDPINEKRSSRSKFRADQDSFMTFERCAKAYIEVHKGSWKNEHHVAQWGRTLEMYVYPIFGDQPISAIDQTGVFKVLDPIWSTKTETASRLRGRIEAILDWARVRGYREGENPARWKGHLAKALPARTKIQPIRHFSALPFRDLPAFMAKLLAVESIGAKAFAFCILNVTRTSETLRAEKTEFNLAEKIWVIPPERMKAKKEHRIPLSEPSLVLFHAVSQLSDPDFKYLFESTKRDGEPLSNMTFLTMLKRMKRMDLTAHGFRSTFRDWAAEATHYPREVAELALAHVIENKVEAAYRRGDLLQKRRQLMSEWATFALGEVPPGLMSSTVISRR
jgi:integrase